MKAETQFIQKAHKKSIIAFALILFSFLGFSQNKALPNLEAYFTAIIVSDMESSINWYSNNFGFIVLNKVESEYRGFKQASLKRENILIELIELKSSLVPKTILANYPEKTMIDGFFKFGFLVSQFDTWVVHLKETKAEFHGNVVADNVTGKKMLILKDPDGNRIQIFEK